MSTKIVVTAAHCIQSKFILRSIKEVFSLILSILDKQDDNIHKAEEALFYLGKHYLHSQPNERDVIASGVTKFVVHPSYNAYVESFDADIAIAVLLRTIQFTNFVKPICLWTSTGNYNDIVNRQGVVAGWGKTETSVSASDKPYFAELPVVDEATCLRSNSVFSKITSRRTFCVGSRDGKGPCNGN